jgi:hypothetical protein
VPLWIFSLNHDVIVEALAARLSIPIHSGFSAATVTLPRRNTTGKKTGQIRAEVLTRHELEHGAMHFPNPPRSGICLLKIHGALDEFTFNDGQDLLKLLPDAPGEAGVIDALRAANEDLFYLQPGAPGGKAKVTNTITYADDHGEMQFLRRSLLAGAFKFDARSSQDLPMSMLRHFRANLNFVSTLICIGYGFGDQHINFALREWLELSRDRRLEIVSPGVDDVPTALLHLSPQVTYSAMAATDYLDSLRSRPSMSAAPEMNLESGDNAPRQPYQRARATSSGNRRQRRASIGTSGIVSGLPAQDNRAQCH